MRIVVVTPVYPPDVEDAAVYIKTLVTKLCVTHAVTVVLYGYLPETVPGVRYVCIDKKPRLIIRLFMFTRALLREARNADVLFVENGPSVELPSLLAGLVSRAVRIVHVGDKRAHAWVRTKFLYRTLEKISTARAHYVHNDSPLPRPEILPFSPKPDQEIKEYEKSWTTHLLQLERLFTHAQR